LNTKYSVAAENGQM